MKKKRAAQISFDFSAKRAQSVSNVLPAKSRRVRMGLLFSIAVLWAGLVGGRLFSLQISDYHTWREWALKQHFTNVELASERGPILDRQGKPLAVSVPASSLYVRPRQVKDKDAAATAIASLLKMEKREVLNRMKSTQPFVWIKRQIPRVDAERVVQLKIAGVGTLLEPRRYYPFNDAASTLIGKVGIDGIGLSGVERMYERTLHMESRKQSATRDALGNLIQLPEEDEHFEIPRGNAVRLTLDSTVQQIMDEELRIGRSNAHSKAVSAVMVNAETGEILGMSQSPSPNFNVMGSASKEEMKNLLVESVFEPGSIFKPIVTAAALEERLVKPEEMINCENGRFPFSKHVIKDVHPSGVISVRDVVVRSSNIGMTKMGIKLGKERLHSYIQRFGFGRPTKLGLPGETEGILRPVSSWALVDVATHSFGQGVAVTPLQIVRALSAIANGGKLPALRLVDDGKPFELQPILSEDVALKVREMMYGVVEDEHGTGSKAVIEGVRIGGKTGTAQKARPNGRGYMPGAYVASFVGFADASAIGIKKNLVLAVMVDEPRGGSIYGGTLAAPVFKRIMQRTLHYYSTARELGELPSSSRPSEQAPYLTTASNNEGIVPVGYSPNQ